MGEEDVGRRERKKRATRAALASAALRLSAEHGVEHVTVEQIADEADVAVRTFFNYFSSKEEAVATGDGSSAEALVEAFCAAPADAGVLGSLRIAMLSMVQRDGYRERVRMLRLLRRSPTLLPHQLAAYAEQERALAEAVALRVGADVDRDLYPALVAAGAMASLRVVVQRWLAEVPDDAPDTDTDTGSATDSATALARLVDQAVDQLGAGLDAPLVPSR